jgi:hypothetical protein
LNEFFTRELAEEGYSGCDVRVTHARTEVFNSTISQQKETKLRLTSQLDHRPCNPHSGGPRREGPSHS